MYINISFHYEFEMHFARKKILICPCIRSVFRSYTYFWTPVIRSIKIGYIIRIKILSRNILHLLKIVFLHEKRNIRCFLISDYVVIRYVWLLNKMTLMCWQYLCYCINIHGDYTILLPPSCSSVYKQVHIYICSSKLLD